MSDYFQLPPYRDDQPLVEYPFYQFYANYQQILGSRYICDISDYEEKCGG